MRRSSSRHREVNLTPCSNSVSAASTGRDGTVDLIQAHKWFNIAAMRGNDDAKRYRLEVARDMSKSEIVQAQKLAREWLTSVH